jgi:hypothetical protein
LFDLVSNHRFNFTGSMRTTDNFLHGFSISFMLAVLCPGALDLVFSCECAGLLKRVALINTIWLAAMSAVSLRYFFALPIFFSGDSAADLCAGLAETTAALCFPRRYRLNLLTTRERQCRRGHTGSRRDGQGRVADRGTGLHLRRTAVKHATPPGRKAIASTV